MDLDPSTSGWGMGTIDRAAAAAPCSCRATFGWVASLSKQKPLGNASPTITSSPGPAHLRDLIDKTFSGGVTCGLLASAVSRPCI